MPTSSHTLAIVTGASSGIGLELAKLAGEHGHDLIIAADEPEIEDAARMLESKGAKLRAVQADLATLEGRRPALRRQSGKLVELLIANAGRGLGHGFSAPGFCVSQAGGGYQHRRHDLPRAKGRSRHAVREQRQDFADWFNRRASCLALSRPSTMAPKRL